MDSPSLETSRLAVAVRSDPEASCVILQHAAKGRDLVKYFVVLLGPGFTAPLRWLREGGLFL